MREFLFFLILLVAALCVVVGVAHYAVGVAWIVGGALFAILGWLVVGGESDASAADEPVGDDS